MNCRLVLRSLIVGMPALCCLTQAGCHVNSPEVTAVPLSQWNRNEPCGIPYYLPKPLLVVAKNVRHVDSSNVGLTDPAPIPDSFDHQSEYADLKANVTNPKDPGAAAAATYNQTTPTAGNVPKQAPGSLGETVTPNRDYDKTLAEDSFFTYQIIFVPDLSQKYGLQIKGGAGEIRAAMNMVNGWMFTGLGPYYLKDSSTAQNRMATGVGVMFAGRGVADVTSAVGDLLKSVPKQAGALDETQVKNTWQTRWMRFEPPLRPEWSRARLLIMQRSLSTSRTSRPMVACNGT
jgi:hypothetical protein